jgi:hypothetical protein
LLIQYLKWRKCDVRGTFLINKSKAEAKRVVAILPIINRANTMIITPTIVHKIRCSVQVVKNVLFDAGVGKPDNYKQVAYSVFKVEKM